MRVNGVSPNGGQQNRVLTTATVVNSYLVHYDPVGTSQNLTRSASFTFGDEILGVVFVDTDLDASDATLGVPGTTYPTGVADRGLEITGSDSYTISPDRRTLNVTLNAGLGADQLRVITLTPDEVLVAEGFDTDDGGWTVAGVPVSSTPIFNLTGKYGDTVPIFEHVESLPRRHRASRGEPIDRNRISPSPARRVSGCRPVPTPAGTCAERRGACRSRSCAPDRARPGRRARSR